MNEKIKELLEKSLRDNSDDAWDEKFQLYRLFPSEIDALAERIVRECALLLYQSALKDSRAGYSHEANVIALHGDMIKQHFGLPVEKV